MVRVSCILITVRLRNMEVPYFEVDIVAGSSAARHKAENFSESSWSIPNVARKADYSHSVYRCDM